MKKIVKYSKSYKNISNLQKKYSEENLINLNLVKKFNEKYIKQKKRLVCQNCKYKINKYTFISFKVKYSICERCGHLNGYHQNTQNFINWVYSIEKGLKHYNYYSKDFKKRVKNIYLPKAKFLKEVIKKKINLIEIGSGAGHFLKALELLKIKSTGYEINKSLVDIGKRKLKINSIVHYSGTETAKVIENGKANVLALVGTLEHFNDPDIVIKSFLKSKIQYLYLGVPLFSLSAFIENVFSNTYPRNLSGDHTNLYTKESLEYLAKKNRLNIVGEWWFGVDMVDLYRSILVSGNKLNQGNYKKYLDKFLFNHLDQMQNILDKNKICSEVQIVFKKKR